MAADGALTQSVATPAGPGRLTWDEAEDTAVVLLLGGGASGQIFTPDLDALAQALPGHGFTVARFEFPWRVAGKKMGPKPPASDPWWNLAVDAVRKRFPGVPLVTGGRSAGARIACRTWNESVLGVIALSFPLHPPGKPDRTRADELRPVAAPVLLVSGARDPFGSIAEFTDELRADHAGARSLVEVVGATHSFPTRTTAALVDAVVGFLGRLADSDSV